MATIKVYGRVAPCSNPSNLVEVQGHRLVTSKLGRRNSQKNALELGFTFADVLGQDACQREIFDTIAKDVIGKFLEGYNGTIFAYGQTGTGKTYTIEGEDLNLDTSPRHGLIPQALAMIFDEIDKLKDECVTIQISFLEMYNEMAYDLLGPLMYGNNNRKDLPRVLVTHGSSGSCTMHGLSLHPVCSEQDARRLHLKGRCNRIVAWTSSNERSSRSHAIFTVLLTRQKQESEVVVKSKLNLVDLAGSERLSKAGTEGQSLFEAKRINLSLHHLETVILALQRLHVQGARNSLSRTLSREDMKPKRCKSAIIPEHERLSRSFNASGWSGLKNCQSTLNVAEVKRKGISLGNVSYIPYRNSLLTMMLQDSLGGNCNTSMIATLSLDNNDLSETISTCRFAQRVARVTNNPVQNKEINEAILIKKLRSQVAKLVKDLNDFKQNNNEQFDSPPEENEAKVIEVVDGYIEGRIVDPTACGIDNPQKVRACLAYLKNLLLRRSKRLPDESTSSDEKDSGVGMNCDHLPPVNDNGNTEEEPSSPSIATDSGTTSEESVPSSPPVTKTTVVKKQRRDAQLKTPSLCSSQTFFPGIIAGESPNCSTTEMSVDEEGWNAANKMLGETEKQLLLLELEIKKENLIQKSKTLSSALSNQKARVVVMEKHGCPMDELDNERLAEQQLRRKQAEIERNLSKTIKKILETKASQCVVRDVTHDQMGDQNSYASAATVQRSKEDPHEPRHDAQTYQRRKLELKERSTRLRLLTCRQRLDRGLMSTGSTGNFASQEKGNDTEVRLDDESKTSPLNSSDEFVVSKALSVAVSGNERLSSDVRSRGRLPSVSTRAQSSVGRRGTIADKRKSKFGISNYRSGPNRGLQAHSPRTSRKSYLNSSRQSQLLPGNGQPSRQSYALPSNARTARQFRISPSNSSSNSFYGGNRVENKNCGKALDRARLIRPYSSAAQKTEEGPSTPASVRSRRPAMCSPALLTSKQSMKRTARPGSSNVHYQYDQSKGFIVRTNEDVYRASNFRQPVPDTLDIKFLDIKRDVSEESSPKSFLLSPAEEQSLQEYDDVTPSSRDAQGHSAVVSKVPNEENEPIRLCRPSQKTQIDSEGNQNQGVVKGSQCDKPKKPLNDDEPKRDMEVQRIVSPVIISARKQQMERARRIRQVTNAVEVIQEAYRRYLWRRNQGILPAKA